MRKLLALLSLVLVAACSRGDHSPAGMSTASPGEATARRTAHCPAGVKVERAPFEIVADAGQLVESACVKAGTRIFVLTAWEPTDGCYTAEGLGTSSAAVTGGGTSRSCKDISYVSFALFRGIPD